MRFELPEDREEAQKVYRDLCYEKDRLESELRRKRDENEFLKSAINHLPNPIFIKTEDLNFYLLNDMYVEQFGIDRNKYAYGSVLDLDFMDYEDRERYHTEDMALIEETEMVNYDQDFVFSDGIPHPCLYWAKGFEVEESGERGLIGEIVDITKERNLEAQLKDSLDQLRAANEEIERASRIDPGTNLYNRYVFDDLTKELIEESQETGKPLSAIMADLDHFKRVNDTFGHLEGDNVLKNFARLIRKNIRSGDVPIRYGGEEFLVFLKNTELEEAKMVAERIRKETGEKLLLPNKEPMTVSIGVVKYDGKETRTHCISRVDEALYTAKNTGRDKVVVFTEGTTPEK